MREVRSSLAERQECRGRHVEHQPAVAEESEDQAIETAEGEAGRREDAQALQGDGSIRLKGKVVAPCPVMAMPLFLFLCEGVANAHARANVKNRLRVR